MGSLTHGVVASATWSAAIDTAVTAFIADQDVQRLQNALANAAKAHAK